MSEQSPQYLGQSLSELRAEAHRLVDAVDCRPGGAKLLLGAIAQLRQFAQYKANRGQLYPWKSRDSHR